MRLLWKSILTALFAIALSVPALSAEKRVVPANRTSPIFFYYTMSLDTCGYGSKSKFTVTRQPEHGSVTAVWTAYKMGKEARNCAGKPLRGMLVTYKPNPGYHGPDKVGFAFNSSESGGYSMGRSYSVNITVK